jgi:hypothetical protein
MTLSSTTIICEHIDDSYGYGDYLGLKIIIHRSTGMVNGAKLCNDYGKQFSEWLRNKKT